MDTQLCKLFHHFGDAYDLKARSFMRAHENIAGTKDSLLLVNQANPRIDLCDWISSENIDFGKCKKAFRRGLPVLVNAPAGVSVSFGKKEKSNIGSAAVLETENTIAFDIAPGFRRLGPEDAQLFDAIENDYSEFNMVEQMKGNLSESSECFGIFEGEALAAFADITGLRGSMFEGCCDLTNIFTARAYRKKGYAAGLLKSILQAYHAKRFYYTATPATNAASVHLALTCGFVPVGEITTYKFI